MTVKIGISQLGPADDSATLTVDAVDGDAVARQTEAIINGLTPTAAGS